MHIVLQTPDIDQESQNGLRTCAELNKVKNELPPLLQENKFLFASMDMVRGKSAERRRIEHELLAAKIFELREEDV